MKILMAFKYSVYENIEKIDNSLSACWVLQFKNTRKVLFNVEKTQPQEDSQKQGGQYPLRQSPTTYEAGHTSTG